MHDLPHVLASRKTNRMDKQNEYKEILLHQNNVLKISELGTILKYM